MGHSIRPFISRDERTGTAKFGKSSSDSQWVDLGESREEKPKSVDKRWLSVEQDLAGNLEIMTISDISNKESIPKLIIDNNSYDSDVEELEFEEIVADLDSTSSKNVQNENKPDWEVVQEDLVLIPANDKSVKQKLDKNARVQSVVMGVSGVVVSTISPSIAISNFILLNSADLVKLGVKGRLSKIGLEQSDPSVQALIQRLALKNGKLSLVTFVASSMSRYLFYSSTGLLPILLIDQLSLLSLLGIEISPLDLAERAITGAVCSVSSQIYAKKKAQKAQPEQKVKLELKKVVWGGVSGAAKGVLGPVLNSPIAEKCVLEAGSKLSTKMLS